MFWLIMLLVIVHFVQHRKIRKEYFKVRTYIDDNTVDKLSTMQYMYWKIKHLLLSVKKRNCLPCAEKKAMLTDEVAPDYNIYTDDMANLLTD
jgi:hypothetical protein